MTKVFIVGTGRCGTASIASALNQLKDVTAVHEPEPKLVDLAEAKMNGESIDLNDLEALRSDLPEHYVESALWNTWLMEEISELWPESRFAWLQRDLLTWAYSAHRRGWYDKWAEEARNRGNMRQLRPRPLSGWPFAGTPDDGKEVSRWFKLGYMYRRYCDEISRVMIQTPVKCVTLSMRDLSDVMRLNGLVRWAGLPGMVQNGEHINKGELYVSAREIMAAGLDSTKLGEELGWDTPLAVNALIGPTPWPKWKLAQIAKENRVQVKLPIEGVQDVLDGVSWIRGRD